MAVHVGVASAGRRQGKWLSRLLAGAGLLLLPGPWSAPPARAATTAVCEPTVAATLDRDTLPLGETLGLSVTLDPRCAGTRERRHLELVLQPTGDAAADGRLGAALADLIDRKSVV